MKKIVILTDQISKIGGITSLIYLKSNYWVTKRDFKVHIITTEQANQNSFYRLNKNIVLHDLSINYERNLSYYNIKNFLKVLKNIFKLQLYLSKIRPDVIIVANHIPATYFLPVLITNCILIKEFHSSKFSYPKRKISILSKFKNFIESLYDYLIVLNKEEQNFYNTNNVLVIPNPIDIDLINPPIYNQRENIAMAAGRISPVKRFDKLIDLWAKFIQLRPDWKLEIYGDGETNYVETLRKKINSQNLKNYVEIKDSTNNIQNIMKTRGLYLMTSSSECFPMVLLEAQTCGLPIIAYDCPTGPRNIINSGIDGILIKLDDENEFVNTLVELTGNKKKREEIAANGYENVKKYNLESVMSIWNEKIFNKIR